MWLMVHCKLKMNSVFYLYYSMSTFRFKEMDGVRGWFLRLCFGHHMSSDSRGAALSQVSLGAISVPVKLINIPQGGKESSCYVVGGFHGIHSSEDGKHRPVMSMGVYEEVEDKQRTNINKRITSS